MAKLNETRFLVKGARASGKMKYTKELDNAKVSKCDACDEEAVSWVLKDQEMIVHSAALYFDPNYFSRLDSMSSANVMWKSLKLLRSLYTYLQKEVYGD